METKFVGGLYLNKVSDNAPAYIITNQDIHVETMIKWLEENRSLANERGYIKIVGKESQAGKRYFQVDTWKPTKQEVQVVGADDITKEFVQPVVNVDLGEVEPESVPF